MNVLLAYKQQSGPKVMLNSTEHEISTAHNKLKCRRIKTFHAFKLFDVFIMLINVKMPTNVGILTLMSMINFMLS